MNYLILAMKRSGSHCFCNWIQAHTGQPFYNNACFGWNQMRFLTMVGKREAKDGIVLIEDFDVDNWNKFEFWSFPFVKNGKVVVFMRNPMTWLASCYARKFQKSEALKDVYKYLQVPYINDSKLQSPSRMDLYCKLMKFGTSLRSCVYFREFIMFKEYRQEVAKALDLEWNEKADSSYLVPSKYGGGSSFENQRYDVFNRDKVFEKDPEFRVLAENFAAKFSQKGKK